MMTLNDNEKNFQKKLQKDTEIPVIVRERANQAYHHIENNTAVQKRETNDKNALRWMKTGGKVVAGTAAVLAAVETVRRSGSKGRGSAQGRQHESAGGQLGRVTDERKEVQG